MSIGAIIWSAKGMAPTRACGLSPGKIWMIRTDLTSLRKGGESIPHRHNGMVERLLA